MANNHLSLPTPALSLIAWHLTNHRHALLSFALTAHAFNEAARPFIFASLTKWVTLDNVEMMSALRGSAAACIRSLILCSHPKTYSLQLETHLTSSILSLIPRFASLAHLSVHQLVSFGTRFAAFPPPSPVGWGIQRLDVGFHQDNLRVMEWVAHMDSLDKVSIWMGGWDRKSKAILELLILPGSSIANKRQLEVEIRIASKSLRCLGTGLGRLLERFLLRMRALAVHMYGSEGLVDGVSSLLGSLGGLSNLQDIQLIIEQDEMSSFNIQEPDNQEAFDHPAYDFISPACIIDQLSMLLFHPSASGSYVSLRRLEVLCVDNIIRAMGVLDDEADDGIWVVYHVVVEIAEGSRLGDGTARVIKNGVIEDAIVLTDGTTADQHQLGW